MRVLLLFISLQIKCFSLFSQYTIIADQGTYSLAENYGGRIELKRFLQQELNYPQKSLENKIEGTVILSFIVEANTGNIRQLEVIKSINEELNREAIRLFNLLLFKPAYYRGNSITTIKTLKIKFTLNRYKKYCKKRTYKNSLPNTLYDTSDSIYTSNKVDVFPEMVFKDSLENLSSFIYSNLRYPKAALKLGISGDVKLFFVIEPSGRITNIKVKRLLGGGTINEAIRLLKLIGWKPGEIKTKKIRVSRELLISFNLPIESGINYVP